LTLLMRLVRSEMLEVMRTDYIKFARARGLTNRAINFGHALKNTLVPVITVTGLQLGSLIAFAIVTETVFAWPGVGQLFIQSVQFADIPVMAAYLMMIGLLFVLINLTVDLLYFAVDPRLRGAGLVRAGGHWGRGPLGFRERAGARRRQRHLVDLQAVVDDGGGGRRPPVHRRDGLPRPGAGTAHAVRPGDTQPQRRAEAAGAAVVRW